jgi:phosphate transport system protein
MHLDQETRTAEAHAPTHNRRSVREFDELWHELLELAALTRRAVDASVRALADDATNTVELAAEAKSAEHEIDRREICLEQTCLRVLALYEPVAVDLRRVATALRVNAELERIGDFAARIAKRAKKQRGAPQYPGLHDLAARVFEQVEQSINLLEHPDCEQAHALIDGDRTIDDIYRALRADLENSIRQEPERVSEWLRFMDTARNLERIGDHAVTIAEAVIYLKDGDTTRHEGRRVHRE